MAQVFANYRVISAEHRRWIDPEDILQEALVAATMDVEPKYDKSGGASFPTYLYTGLVNRLSHVRAPLRRVKRAATAMVELDAPVGEDGDQEFQLPSDETEPGTLQVEGAVKGFLALCRLLKPATLRGLVTQLLCGQEVRGIAGRLGSTEPSAVDEIRAAIKKVGLELSDLELIVQHTETRKKCLTRVGGLVSIVSGEADGPVLECSVCHGRSMISSITSKQFPFNVETMTCSSCYKKLSKSRKSCFGKKFLATAVECKLHCPDKKVCGAVVQTKERKRKMKDEELDTETVENETEDEDFSTIDESAVETAKAKGTAKKAAKTEKTVKTSTKKSAAATKKAPAKSEKKAATPSKKVAAKETKKTAKPTKDADDGMLPFRAGTAKRWVISQAVKKEGVSIKTLKAKLVAAGNNFNFMMNVLKGNAGFVKGKETHKWKFREEDGTAYVYDMKKVA
jgi:DNA-directed RNA polymerase specialized sigma24 family protein